LTEFGFWNDVEPDKFSIDRWLDKKIIRSDQNLLKSVKIIKTGKTRLEIVKKESSDDLKWKTVEKYPFRLSQKNIDRFLRNLFGASASKVIPLNPPDPEHVSDIQAVMTFEDEETITVDIEKNSEGIILRVPGRGYAYEIVKSVYKR